MEEPRIYTTEARELDRAERGTIVCAREEGRKRLEEKKEEKKSDSRQKKSQERKKKEGEWKKRRQNNRGVKEK